MALDFRIQRVNFSTATPITSPNLGKILSARSYFDAPIRRIQAALNGFDVRFRNGDHHLERFQVNCDVRVDPDNRHYFIVTVNLLLHDSPRNFDDPFDGYADVLLIADTE